jgi:L-threonylcarbamoyladenylate synthase
MAIISNCTASVIKDAALALKKGHLVAFPTETVYGLGADATNERAVSRIYEVKGRPKDHPLIVHISSMELLDLWASEIPEYAVQLARSFWPGPMTLVLPRTNLAKDFISGGQDTVAVRVPSHALAQHLLKEFETQGGTGVVAPSANRFGKVSPTISEAVEEELGNFLSESDQILDGGPSQIGVESTIIDCTQNIPRILRSGGTTFEMIKDVLPIKLRKYNPRINNLRVPGLIRNHYAPRAEVKLSGVPKEGDGFIALDKVPTPSGAIRLGKPVDVRQFAQMLYSLLRQADSMELKRVFVVTPQQQGLWVAINDRLNRMKS